MNQAAVTNEYTRARGRISGIHFVYIQGRCLLYFFAHIFYTWTHDLHQCLYKGVNNKKLTEYIRGEV